MFTHLMVCLLHINDTWVLVSLTDGLHVFQVVVFLCQGQRDKLKGSKGLQLEAGKSSEDPVTSQSSVRSEIIQCGKRIRANWRFTLAYLRLKYDMSGRERWCGRTALWPPPPLW
jgi:hypothetical protein